MYDKYQNKALNNNRVIVIGADTVAGKAAIELSSAEGASVVAFYRNKENLEADLLAATAENLSFVQHICSDHHFENLFAQTGPFDHLVYILPKEPIRKSRPGNVFKNRWCYLEYWFKGVIAAIKYASPFILPGGSITICTASQPSGKRGVNQICFEEVLTTFIHIMAGQLKPIRLNVISGGLANPVYTIQAQPSVNLFESAVS